MKHIITITSLLAAGTILANAETTKIADMGTLVSNATNNGVTISSEWIYNGGSVYDFSAENAYFSSGSLEAVSNAINVDSGFVTIGAWVYFDALSGQNTLFGWGESEKGFKFNIKLGGAKGDDTSIGEMAFVTKNVQQVLSQTFSTSDFNGGWHHIALSFDAGNNGTSCAFFLDGAAKGTNTLSAWNDATTLQYAIGSQVSDSYGEGFNGLMAGLSLYASNSILTATDIASIMGNAPSAVPEPSAFGLLAGLGALALAGTRRRRAKKA